MPLLDCWHPGLVAAVKFSTRRPRKERSTGVGKVPVVVRGREQDTWWQCSQALPEQCACQVASPDVTCHIAERSA